MASVTTGNGIDIWYEEAGEGPPLVLVHGITESAEMWAPLVPDLATDHRVVALDLRGHGRSSRAQPYDTVTFATDVHEVLDGLGIGGEAVLVGHSLGGVVVTGYAALHGCRGVVNVDQSLDLGSFQAGLQLLAPMLRGDDAEFRQAIDMVFGSMQGQLEGAEAERVAAIHHPEQDVVLGVWDPVIDLPADELQALVRSLGEPVRVPYLALHGIDPGEAYGDWLRALIPTATYELWPGVGHYPHLVEPQRFTSRVREFEAGLA